jgi:hypothetical protein
VGAGLGWLKPSALSGAVLPSSGWGWQVTTGWRKGFFGLELGYLGAKLRSTGGSDVMPLAGETDAPTAYDGSYYAPVDDRARLGHLTLDAKLYLRLLCRLSVFLRLGINHTRIVQGGWFDQAGWGWQYGTGLDYRLRLSGRPDLVLKLRGEVVKLDAALAPRGGGDRQAYSTLGVLFSENLGWAPR